MNAMNAINAMTKKQNNATTCNQPNGGENGGGKVTPAHYEELEELQLESVAGTWFGVVWGWFGVVSREF